MVFRKAAGWGSLRNGVFLPYDSAPLASISVGGGSPPPAITNVSVVHPNGFTGTWSSVATAFPANTLDISDAQTLAVTRPGFDASGNATTTTTNVAITKRLREAWPNQANQTAESVVLAETVYVGDTLPAGVLNTSSVIYPVPQTCWLQPDYFPITDGTFTVDLVVVHSHARNGRPVAAVDIVASDGTNERTVTVTSLTFVSYTASGLGVDVYRATFTSTDFLEATAITINAIVKPWCGPSYNLLTQGLAAPNIKNTVIRGYRVTPVYAYVSPSGNDSTGQASTNAATAAGLPFLTVNAALTTATRGITAVTGRSEAGGGVVRFPVGTWNWVKTSLSGVTVNTASVVFESINPSDRDTTIIASTSGTTGHSLPNRAIVRNVTLRKIGDAEALMRGDGTASGAVVFDNCVLDRNGQTQRTYWINFLGRGWFINCTDNLASSTGAMQANATDPKNVISIGSVMAGNCCITRIASVTNNVSVADRAAVTLGFAYGMHVNNVISSNASGFIASLDGPATGTSAGLAYWMQGNVIERFGSTGGCVTALADGNTQGCNNFGFMSNTLAWSSGPAGEDTRFNSLYSDVAGATANKNMHMRFSVMSRCARKTDAFAAAVMSPVGNWPVAFGVDHAYNTLLEGTTAPDSTPVGGPPSWRFEVLYPGIQIGDGGSGALNPLWVSDASISGTGLGGGNYRPQAGSPLNRIPAGMTITARDMLGQTIPTNGTAFVGALQAA